LGIRKISAKSVPVLLTDDQRQQQFLANKNMGVVLNSSCVTDWHCVISCFWEWNCSCKHIAVYDNS